MRLMNGIIETPVTRPGMRIIDALRICVAHRVPGLPYVDENGEIAGRFSVRHAYLISSIAPDMIKGAHLIGHEALHLERPVEHYAGVFRNPIDSMILEDVAALASDAQIIKAVALMEKFNSSYLFIIDNGEYRGVVTRLTLTGVLLEEL